MIRASRPQWPEPQPPLAIPRHDWTPAERRFLKAAIRCAEELRSWWLEREAIILEKALSDADD